jgi:hypothetical protein
MKDCCPKCGSDIGFSYKLVISYDMVGAWGESALAEMQRTVSKTIPTCISCNKRVDIKIAEDWEGQHNT